MARTPARRARLAPAIEPLEGRTLMSVAAGDDPSRTLLVGFVDHAAPRAERALMQAAGVRAVRSYPDGPTLVELTGRTNRDAALRRLSASRLVRYAEANAPLRPLAVVPNDPQFGSQWGLNSPNDVDIDAPEGWQASIGNPGTVVAVIDSGLDFTHPDLAGRLWTNAREVPGNGRDDDRNGYVDDVHGWNFLNRNNNLYDYNGHGTHVAGILGAAGNDGFAGAGVDWAARIMPLKFLDAGGNGSIDDAVRAVYYAVDNGARVINASWGGGDASKALLDALAYANSRNVVFVTAAGNDGLDNDVAPSFPANYALPNVLSVAAVDQGGNLASFSDYGAHSVAIAAPGVNILSTIPGGRTTSYTGTSMATPFVSGVASILVGLHPEWTAAQLVQRIVATAKPLPGLAGKVIAGGMVDLARAVAGIEAPTATAAAARVSADDLHAAILASDEYFQLNGGTPAGYVGGLYRDLLGRAADPGGLQFWTGQLGAGQPRAAIAAALLGSDEGMRVRVARWYADALRRPGTLGQLEQDPGVVSWARQIVGGLVRPDDVLAQILASDEFYAVHGGTADGYVGGLYRVLLGRDPEPAGLIGWRLALFRGVGRVDVARGIMGTTEAARYLVAGWYSAELRRPGTLGQLELDAGVVAWADQLVEAR